MAHSNQIGIIQKCFANAISTRVKQKAIALMELMCLATIRFAPQRQLGLPLLPRPYLKLSILNNFYYSDN